MPSHNSLFMLHNVMAAPRVVYLLRTASCCDSPELLLYDAVLCDSLSTTLNVVLVDNSWTLVSLPVRWGGLDNETIRVVAGFRLGAPAVRPHVCVCGATVTVDGHHGLSCRRGSGRHCRHNQVNDTLSRFHKHRHLSDA